MPLVTLVITACLIGTPPDEPPKCEPPFRVPVAGLTMQECAIHGQAIVIEIMSDPYFEFHELREWKCEIGEEL